MRVDATLLKPNEIEHIKRCQCVRHAAPALAKKYKISITRVYRIWKGMDPQQQSDFQPPPHAALRYKAEHEKQQEQRHQQLMTRVEGEKRVRFSK